MNDLEKHFDQFRKNIDEGNLSLKPGWIRLSLHPTMLNKEVVYVMNSISELAQNFKEWSKDYKYVSKTNEFEFIAENHSCKNKRDQKFGLNYLLSNFLITFFTLK